jgi:folate-binding protein YgfZ
MTTNDVEHLTPGTGCYAYFLSAQGRILADVNLFCRPDHFLLDTEPETREKVFRHLDAFIIADDVTLGDVTDETAAIAIEGPEAAAMLAKIGVPHPEDEFDSIEWNGALVVRATYTGATGFVIVVSKTERESLVNRLESAGVVRSSEEAFRIVRLENGRPRYGEEISERYLAQETNQSRALHFQKGCYLGQEIVERVRSRGQVHRVLVDVHVEATEPPEAGTKLQTRAEAERGAADPEPVETASSRAGESIASEPSAGEIASAAFSPALGKVAALAYVRVEHARPGATLYLAGTQVAVTVVRGAS